MASSLLLTPKLNLRRAAQLQLPALIARAFDPAQTQQQSLQQHLQQHRNAASASRPSSPSSSSSSRSFTRGTMQAAGAPVVGSAVRYWHALQVASPRGLAGAAERPGRGGNPRGRAPQKKKPSCSRPPSSLVIGRSIAPRIAHTTVLAAAPRRRLDGDGVGHRQAEPPGQRGDGAAVSWFFFSWRGGVAAVARGRGDDASASGGPVVVARRVFCFPSPCRSARQGVRSCPL